MVIELQGKLTKITNTETFGKDQSNLQEKFTLVLTKSYIDQFDQQQINTYAIQVFPKEGKNSRESFEHLKDKIVKVKAGLKSASYLDQKTQEIKYINNINFFAIEVVQNTLSTLTAHDVKQIHIEEKIVEKGINISKLPPENLFSENIESDDLPF